MKSYHGAAGLVSDSSPQAVGDKLWDEDKLANFLDVSVKTLQAWRIRGRGPEFVKVGRLVRYNPRSINDFVAQNTMLHTAAKAEPDAASTDNQKTNSRSSIENSPA